MVFEESVDLFALIITEEYALHTPIMSHVPQMSTEPSGSAKIPAKPGRFGVLP
jgi:hypothetical protein